MREALEEPPQRAVHRAGRVDAAGEAQVLVAVALVGREAPTDTIDVDLHRHHHRLGGATAGDAELGEEDAVAFGGSELHVEAERHEEVVACAVTHLLVGIEVVAIAVDVDLPADHVAVFDDGHKHRRLPVECLVGHRRVVLHAWGNGDLER